MKFLKQMEILFILVLIIISFVITTKFRKFSKEKYESKLLDEIENDFLEDFSWDDSNLNDNESSNLKGLVEWVEDIQLEDKINKKTSIR